MKIDGEKYHQNLPTSSANNIASSDSGIFLSALDIDTSVQQHIETIDKTNNVNSSSKFKTEKMKLKFLNEQNDNSSNNTKIDKLYLAKDYNVTKQRLSMSYNLNNEDNFDLNNTRSNQKFEMRKFSLPDIYQVSDNTITTTIATKNTNFDNKFLKKPQIVQTHSEQQMVFGKKLKQQNFGDAKHIDIKVHNENPIDYLYDVTTTTACPKVSVVRPSGKYSESTTVETGDFSIDPKLINKWDGLKQAQYFVDDENGSPKIQESAIEKQRVLEEKKLRKQQARQERATCSCFSFLKLSRKLKEICK
jgi:hypothetical protein